MKVNGIELLQMIKDGKIKEGTKVKYLCENLIVIDEYLAYENPCCEVGCSLITSDNYFEIIEEDKPIEKILVEQDEPGNNFYIKNEYGTKCGLTKHSKMIAEKLNELIDEVNKLKKEKENE